MMSQQRTRKAVGADPISRCRPSVKGSGDTPSNVQNKQQRHRSRSKSKIPKNLRYDLENALVGLCDVWFEEIKPHLVRNNIKVHVHEGERGPASGDYECLPPGAAGCSHLDPGAAPDLQRRRRANCAGSYSTQPTASRARSRKPPAPLCPPVLPARHSLPERERDSLTQNPYQSFEAKQSARRRKRHGVSSQVHHGERQLRLCRTYSVIPPHTPRTPRPRRIQTAVETYGQYTEQPKPLFHGPRRRKLKMVDKSTQTPPLRCPATSTKVHLELEQTRATAQIPYTRRPSSTDFVPKQQYGRTSRSSAFFKEDLIEIIAEQSEKQLRCIYKSPGRADSCSTFNLMTNYRTKYHTMRGKKKPWR